MRFTSWMAVGMLCALVAHWPLSGHAAQAQEQESSGWSEGDYFEEPEEVLGVEGPLFHWNGLSPEPPDDDGEEEPLVSDRPDFTEASSTVGRGRRQIEIGYTFETEGEGIDRSDTHSVPEVLLRWGSGMDWLEWRIGWAHGIEHTPLGPAPRSTSGSGDLYLGAKLGLTRQAGVLPEMALVPQMTVPLGGPFSAERVLPGVNWLYGWDLNDFLSTAGSTQVNMAVDDDTRDNYAEFAQSWTIGYSLTERIGAYTEWFVFLPVGGDTARTENYADGGFTYSYSPDLQFDIRGGLGLNEAAVDYFTGVGLVKRW